MTNSKESVYSYELTKKAHQRKIPKFEVFMNPEKGYLPSARPYMVAVLGDHATLGIWLDGWLYVSEPSMTEALSLLYKVGYYKKALVISDTCFGWRNAGKTAYELWRRKIPGVWLLTGSGLQGPEDAKKNDCVGDYVVSTQLIKIQGKRASLSIGFWRGFQAMLPHYLDATPARFASQLRVMTGVYGMYPMCFHSSTGEAVEADFVPADELGATPTTMGTFFGSPSAFAALEPWFEAHKPGAAGSGAGVPAIDDLPRALTLSELRRISGARSGESAGGKAAEDPVETGDGRLQRVIRDLFRRLGVTEPEFDDDEHFWCPAYEALSALQGPECEAWLEIIWRLGIFSRGLELTRDWRVGIILLRASGAQPATVAAKLSELIPRFELLGDQ
jgi:hypothetical protein